MSLYEKIKNLANRKKISISRLERENGISSGTITKWDKAMPTAENLHKVAKSLGTTVEELLDSDEKEITEK